MRCSSCRQYNESQMSDVREVILIVGALYLATFTSDIYDFIYYKVVDLWS